MKPLDFIQILAYFGLLFLCAPFLGAYMAKVFNKEKVFLSPLVEPIKQRVFHLAGVNPEIEQNWKQYTYALLSFSFIGFIVLFLLQIFQKGLPLNPVGLPGVELSLAFNTASSFITNTNWQSYAGETTMSHLTQMAGLAVQNFISAATGIAVAVALIRGLKRRSESTIGNFWVDIVNSVLYLLLPLSIVLAIVLVSQGVPQNFSSPVKASTLMGDSQMLPQGPVASQIAIKQLGTNGGGFFSTNSAHPYENPTPLSGFFEMFSILLIPVSLTFTYGKMIGSPRQGRVIFAAMLILLLAGLSVMLVSEHSANPAPGLSGSLEGKEMRFGISNSVLWSSVTTATSNGSVNSMNSSLSPLSGGIALLNIMIGEVIFGGAGSGLYGMLIFVILTVFIAGLMVGRTPEYLGKKIEAHEIKMAMIAVLLPSACILLFSALASVTETGLSSRSTSGPHGLTEILYAFSSASQNNGSAFAGLNTNTVFYNLLMGMAMWIGRFGVIIPSLAIAGSMVNKKIAPPSPGTFSTDTMLFGVLLIGVILIIGGLTFFPALSLGPVAEQLLLNTGRYY